MVNLSANEIQAALLLGPHLARSGFIPLGNESSGIVVALECLATGTTPLAWAQSYNVIYGKVSMKSERMLANFEARGGKYRVIARTPEEASIELKKGDVVFVSSASHEEVKQEKFYWHPKMADCVSDNYRTPRRRMQALWARAVSDGIRVVDPAVNSGLYTEEEAEDIATADSSAAAQSPTVAAPAFYGYEPPMAPEPPANTPSVAAEVSHDSPGSCNTMQLAKLEQLAIDVYAEKAQDILVNAAKKRGAETISDLSSNQVEELITRLEERLNQPAKN